MPYERTIDIDSNVQLGSPQPFELLKTLDSTFPQISPENSSSTRQQESKQEPNWRGVEQLYHGHIGDEVDLEIANYLNTDTEGLEVQIPIIRLGVEVYLAGMAKVEVEMGKSKEVVVKGKALTFK